MRKKYPSDISQMQFEKIRPLLEAARKKTRPRIIDLYEVYCAVLYVLKSGCQWRMLPRDFPKWRNVYSYFQIWNERIGEVRISSGWNEKTSFCIIDAQSEHRHSREDKDTMQVKRFLGSSIILL